MKVLLRLIVGLVAIVAVVLVGGYFALRRADMPYAALEAKYASPIDHFVDLKDGVRARYRIQGKPDGRTLLLIHGFGASLETWEPWARELNDGYRVVSVDLPGHGLTRKSPGYPPTMLAFAEFVNEFAGAIGLRTFTIAGNSMGGITAWLVALRHPERVDALVLIDASGWPEGDQEQDPPFVFKLLQSERIAPLFATLDPKPLMKNTMRAVYASQAFVTDDIVTRTWDFICAPGNRYFLGTIQRDSSPEGLATKDKLAAIKVPTLILWGDKDQLIPVSDAQRFVDAIAGSKAIIYPAVGHVPQEEAAAKSAADLRTFLADHAVAEAHAETEKRQ